jgi:urease accessory protein
MVLARANTVVPTKDAGGNTPDDEIVLTWVVRHRRRIRMTSTGGKEFLLDLPKAAALADGDQLVLDDGSRVRVCASAEPVADIEADSPAALTRIAWHLGNRHWPTQLLDNGLRIRFDHVLVDMVEGLGGRVTLRDAAFHPESGAYAHEH